MDAMMMLRVMALGLGTVFTVLVLLILVIGLINKLIGGASKKPAAAKAPAPVSAETVPAAHVEEDGAIVAAITAAVCACLNTSTHNFRVRSIREHKPRRSRW